MDKDRVIGTGKHLLGTVKLALGKQFGDSRLQFAGTKERLAGKIQSAFGRFKTRMRP
jgi:uncharacterized protein YjbJ (UPF0337 family)